MRPSLTSGLLALLCTAAIAPAWAVLPAKNQERDIKRFGLDRPGTRVRSISSADLQAIAKLPGPLSALGGASTPDQAAGAFLRSGADLLGLDPATLVLERRQAASGLTHFLYRQTYRGLPVEFSRIKVHVGAAGAVVGADSAYERGLALDTVPGVPASVAAETVRQDAGAAPREEGRLVVYPDPRGGPARLAWKFTVGAKLALWRYYVDAQDGSLLFRYNDLRLQVPVCLTSGTVMGQVYDIDPSTTPTSVLRPFMHQKVCVGSGASCVVTGGAPVFGQGFFCSGTAGKIATSLQGPYVNVASFRGPSAHYDNGSGVWSTVATPVSSPHPYPNSSTLYSTIDISAVAPNAVKFLPVFSSFAVGRFDSDVFGGEGGELTDDDQVAILDADGNPVAGYVGSRGAFNGAAVNGTSLRLRLTSNGAGQESGYDVSLSSYLSLSNPFSTSLSGSSLTWSAGHTSNGLRGEFHVFYHLNKMHDYFMADVNRSSAAYIGKPVNAMVHVGPDLAGAFYNPDQDNLAFGDFSSASPSDLFAEDATASHHEYVHYVVEKIWPIQNFGQAGAISEGVADYFAASSLDYSSIGRHIVAGLGGSGALRELDCAAYPGECRSLSVNAWTGEIHDDSRYLSQALWEIRGDRVAALGLAAGRSCADGLAFQALLSFPESFAEFLDAMRRVDSAGAVAACGGANAVQGVINAKFLAHGLTTPGADALEGPRRNDGFETAVDLSTYTSAAATISPAADIDFYTFGAGPGPVSIVLRLPPDGPQYKAYAMTLFDSSRREVARADPPYDGINTFAGACEADDCTSSASSVVLTYNNPSGGQLYLQVAGGPTASGGSNSGVNSPVAYVLEPTYPRAAALSGGIVSAVFDRDTIAFTVRVTTFPRTQDYRFAYAQLRNHAHELLPGTDTRSAGYLDFLSSANALGAVSGQVRLAPGFAARFPAVGTVHLEVFGCNVAGSTVSLGESQPLNLTSGGTGLTAYNNIFNPRRGEKATIKFETASAGRVTIRLYNLAGTHVMTLFDGDLPAGKGSTDWAGTNFNGATVASGIYIVHLNGPGVSKTQKIVVVK